MVKDTTNSPKMAKIITIFNDKGGAGKTTTTCQLAGTFGHRGYEVLVADLDPSQPASTWLGNKQGQNYPGTLWSGHRYEGNTATELGKLATKYDLIFVDCAASAKQPGTWASLLVSDLALIPTLLDPTDLNALPTAVALGKRAQIEAGRKFPVRIVATAFSKRSFDHQMALSLIRENEAYAEIPLLNTVLSDRVAFTRSMSFGATVHSMPNAKDAITEIDSLADAVAKLLQIPASKD